MVFQLLRIEINFVAVYTDSIFLTNR